MRGVLACLAALALALAAAAPGGAAEQGPGELQNPVIYTYPKVSQFWKYNKEEHLKGTPYDRNYPPCRFCQ
jgi:hypothetical protein